MRDDVFEIEDIDLIAGGISLQRGKLPEHVITLADEWLLRASRFERRALRARSHPVPCVNRDKRAFETES